MIPRLVAAAPESLVAMTGKMTIGLGIGASPWWDDATFDDMLTLFAAGYERPERRALASLWSQYYLAALMIPTTVALLRLDLVLPVAFDEMTVDVGADGLVERFRLRDAGQEQDTAGGARFDRLLHGHLRPFVEACAQRTRLSRRVLWSNAATILDYALGELAATPAASTARAEAESLLRGGAGSPLGTPFRVAEDGRCLRKVCCLRYRLHGVPRCAGICPLDRPVIEGADRCESPNPD